MVFSLREAGQGRLICGRRMPEKTFGKAMAEVCPKPPQGPLAIAFLFLLLTRFKQEDRLLTAPSLQTYNEYVVGIFGILGTAGPMENRKEGVEL
jgi:hypothetical protein